MSAQRKSIGIAIAVAIVAMGAFWYFVLAPKQREAAAIADRVTDVQAKLDETRRKAAQLRVAKSSHDVDYASIVRLGKAVPTDDDVRSLVVQLDTAAKRSGVDFRSIKLSGTDGSATPPAAPAAGAAAAQTTTATLPPGASVGAAGFPTMPFNFGFTGSFLSLSDFFSRLERMVDVSEKRVRVGGRLLAIDGFSLKPGDDGFPLVVASIGATAYLLPKSEGMPLASTMSAATGATPQGTAPSAPPVTTATTTGAVR